MLAIPETTASRCPSDRHVFATLAVAGAVGWLVLVSPPAHADLFFGAQTGSLYDTNLTRAQQRADIRADGAATLAATVGWFDALSGHDALTFSLQAQAELYYRFHGLNNVDAGPGVEYRHKFGTGLEAPWVSIGAGGSYSGFVDAIRDSDRLAVSVEFGRRLTETFDASIGAIDERRYAKTDSPVVPRISGKVFSQEGRSVFARASYDITDRLQTAVRLSVRRGDVESTTRINTAIFLASDAIAPDPAFGTDFFAYRLRGTTATFVGSMSWALSDNSSLNLGYVEARTRAMMGLDYRSTTTNVTLAYRY